MWFKAKHRAPEEGNDKMFLWNIHLISSPSPPCSVLWPEWHHIDLSHTYTHVGRDSSPSPKEQLPRSAMASMPLPSKAEFWMGGMAEVKPEKAANIMLAWGPIWTLLKVHIITSTAFRSLWIVPALVAPFTILVALHRNRRALSSQSWVLTHACWKGILEFESGCREAEECYSAKLMALNLRKPSACWVSQAWQRGWQQKWSQPQPWLAQVWRLKDSYWGPRSCAGFPSQVSPTLRSEPVLEPTQMLPLVVVYGKAMAQLGYR